MVSKSFIVASSNQSCRVYLLGDIFAVRKWCSSVPTWYTTARALFRLCVVEVSREESSSLTLPQARWHKKHLSLLKHTREKHRNSCDSTRNVVIVKYYLADSHQLQLKKGLIQPTFSSQVRMESLKGSPTGVSPLERPLMIMPRLLKAFLIWAVSRRRWDNVSRCDTVRPSTPPPPPPAPRSRPVRPSEDRLLATTSRSEPARSTIWTRVSPVGVFTCEPIAKKTGCVKSKGPRVLDNAPRVGLPFTTLVQRCRSNFRLCMGCHDSISVQAPVYSLKIDPPDAHSSRNSKT